MSSESGGSFVGDTSSSTYESIDTILLNSTQIDPEQPLRQSLFIENIEENKHNISSRRDISNSDTASSEHMRKRSIPNKLYAAYNDDSKLSSTSSQTDMQTSTPSRDKSSDEHSSLEKRAGYQPVAVHTTRPIDFQNEAIDELCENVSETNTRCGPLLDRTDVSDSVRNSEQSISSRINLSQFDGTGSPCVSIDIVNPALPEEEVISNIVSNRQQTYDRLNTETINIISTSNQQRESINSVDTDLILSQCDEKDQSSNKRDSIHSVETNLVLNQCDGTDNQGPTNNYRESVNSADTNQYSGTRMQGVFSDNRVSAQTVDTDLVLVQRNGTRNTSDNSVINPAISGSHEILGLANNGARTSDPISASRLDVVSLSGDDSSDERDRQMEILEQEVSPRLYPVAGHNTYPLQRTASQELRLFAEEHRGIAPPESFKFESEFVPLSYNLSRKSSFVSAQESPSNTPQKSTSAKKGPLTQSPFLIGKLLVASPDNSSGSERQDSNDSNESSGGKPYYGSRDRKKGYVAIPVLKDVSGSSRWRNGSTSTVSLHMNTPTRPHLAKYQQNSPDSLVLPDIEPKVSEYGKEDEATVSTTKADHITTKNSANVTSGNINKRFSNIGEQPAVSKAVSMGGVPKLSQTNRTVLKEKIGQPQNESEIVRNRPKSSSLGLDNEKELLPPEDAAQSSSRGSKQSRSYPNPHAQSVGELYNDDMFSDMEDGLDIEYLGNMIRARRDDSYSIQSINSNDFDFFDLYSSKRIALLLTLCLLSPPVFFIFGLSFGRNPNKVHLVSDYKLMKLLMNSKHRSGLLKGFLWEVDMSWFRKMCLILGLLELCAAIAGIAIGLGVGLTRN
ncbi:hypothetical protein RNJ44_00768 [Nakaseomyces bracarensis]|uniref:Uncharacterized protein n=1 Tax=Nakaseomyces bracarensis TaxID=273131 RepID=A0ABR4NS44_9SACH